MRKSSVQLVLASTLPLAISACSVQEDTYTFSKKQNYQNVQACVQDKVPVDVCSDAYMQALADHRRIAPTYDNQKDCDADFVEGYCQVTSDGKFMPRLGGFELAVTGQVTQSQVDAAQAQAAQATGSSGGGGGGGDNGFLTGLLLGQVLNGGGSHHYYSQPIYQSRDSRGSYQMSSLSRQIEQGKTFGRSTQARASTTSSYTEKTLGRSLSSGSGTTKTSVASTISRSGFGSEATARGGWGGRSGGFSSGT